MRQRSNGCGITIGLTSIFDLPMIAPLLPAGLSAWLVRLQTMLDEDPSPVEPDKLTANIQTGSRIDKSVLAALLLVAIV
jgi:hypothetical protein